MSFQLTKDLLKTIYPRPSVMLLARLMEFKLQKNAQKSNNWPALAFDKGGRIWEDLSLDYLVSRLEDERLELDVELSKKVTTMKDHFDPIEVILECADEANFLMMIVDNVMEGRILDGLKNKVLEGYPYSKDMSKPDDDDEYVSRPDYASGSG